MKKLEPIIVQGSMMAALDNNRLLKTGVTGTCVAVICCVTPALVILVSAVGLSAIIGWLDFILFPALALFLGIAGYALYKRRQERRQGPAVRS